jgi:hypothetical protein
MGMGVRNDQLFGNFFVTIVHLKAKILLPENKIQKWFVQRAVCARLL